MSVVWVNCDMKPAEPCRMNWALSSSMALSNTRKRRSRLMFIATHPTIIVPASMKTCFRNVLNTIRLTTISTVWNGSFGRNRSSHGARFLAE